jgi:hypothetical protein
MPGGGHRELNLHHFRMRTLEASGETLTTSWVRGDGFGISQGVWSISAN